MRRDPILLSEMEAKRHEEVDFLVYFSEWSRRSMRVTFRKVRDGSVGKTKKRVCRTWWEREKKEG